MTLKFMLSRGDEKRKKTSPKGFSAFKCECREMDIFKILGIFWQFLAIFLEFIFKILWEFSLIVYIFKIENRTNWNRTYWGIPVEGIDLFVEIVVFVKILSKGRRKHGLRTPREEIAFTAWVKIHSHSQIFMHDRSIFFRYFWFMLSLGVRSPWKEEKISILKSASGSSSHLKISLPRGNRIKPP